MTNQLGIAMLELVLRASPLGWRLRRAAAVVLIGSSQTDLLHAHAGTDDVGRRHFGAEQWRLQIVGRAVISILVFKFTLPAGHSCSELSRVLGPKQKDVSVETSETKVDDSKQH